MRQTCPECGNPIKLTKQDVQDIFQMSYSLGEIAKEAGVSRQTVWKIKKRLLYAAWTDELEVNSAR